MAKASASVKKMFSTAGALKNNILVKNFLSLGVVQAVNLAIPLLVTPYLVKVLGLENFGRVTFAAAIMFFFSMFIDYGFNLYFTKEVAVNRADTSTVSKLLSVSVITRVLLLTISAAAVLILFLFPKFSADKILFAGSFCIVIGNAFLPSWIFQGLENLKPYAVINVCCRLIYIAVIFACIKRPGHYIYINILWGCTAILSAVVSFIYLNRKYTLRFVSVTITDIKLALKKCFPYFISNFSINIYTYCSSAILGLFASYEVVGMYGVAEKIFQILKQPLIIYSQVIYPGACIKASESINAFRKHIKKIYPPLFIAFMLGLLVVFIFSRQIGSYFQSTNLDELQLLIRLMVIATFFTCLNIPAYQSLLAFGFHKSYSIVSVVGSALSILLNFYFSSHFGADGTAFNLMLAEFMIMFGLHIVLYALHRNYYFIGNSQQAI